MIDSSINPNIDRIALRLKTIPENPGVYQHLDAEGKVIYVGKARNLYNRVSSYFSHYEDKSPKIKMLVRSVYDIRVTVVATEVDALLLENSLIKRYQPRYNSLLKDDKTYPYLCITDEEYPRLLYTRKKGQSGLKGQKGQSGQYYGPYPNGTILRELQNIIRQLFQYRTCNTMGKRPCMKHQIGLCGAPCAGKQSKEEYRAIFDDIRRILRGDFGDILDEMKRQMYAAAEELKFEKAEAIKQKIHLLEEYQSHSTVVDTNVRDVDVISILSDDSYAYVNFMRVKNGALIYSISNEIKKQLDESDAEILATVIPSYHQQSQSSAGEVILPLVLPDLPEDYLRQTVDPKGDRRKLLELSLRNVESYQKQCRHQRALLSGQRGQNGQMGQNGSDPLDPLVPLDRLDLIKRLQKALNLPTLPMEIECFDNSNIQGAYPVAGMVRFSGGKPNRKEYRKFNIKGETSDVRRETKGLSPLTSHLSPRINDDYASMAEVIERRYSRLAAEEKPLPDLLIVDGGEGQMRIAWEVIHNKLGLDIPIAGLAKNDRHRTNQLLVCSGECEIMTVQLKPTDPLFHLLEQIQNEVHRFAITFHKDKRSKGTFRTSLTDIPGIGEKTAHSLLLRFGSVKQISLQTFDDLAAVIGPAKARLVYDELKVES